VRLDPRLGPVQIGDERLQPRHVRLQQCLRLPTRGLDHSRTRSTSAACPGFGHCVHTSARALSAAIMRSSKSACMRSASSSLSSSSISNCPRGVTSMGREQSSASGPARAQFTSLIYRSRTCAVSTMRSSSCASARMRAWTTRERERRSVNIAIAGTMMVRCSVGSRVPPRDVRWRWPGREHATNKEA
jgi:hypothetical protein